MPKVLLEVEFEGSEDEALSAIAACPAVTRVTPDVDAHVSHVLARRLDDLIKQHPDIAEDVCKLIETRVPVSLATVQSDLLVAVVGDVGYSLGALGLLNTVCLAQSTGTYVMARYDDDRVELRGFVAGEPKWKT